MPSANLIWERSNRSRPVTTRTHSQVSETLPLVSVFRPLPKDADGVAGHLWECRPARLDSLSARGSTTNREGNPTSRNSLIQLLRRKILLKNARFLIFFGRSYTLGRPNRAFSRPIAPDRDDSAHQQQTERSTSASYQLTARERVAR